MPATSIAEELAKKQREISVSEFFERNKQILGYDSPTKALLTVVKEGTDNALDAAADADILPDVYVEVQKVDKDEFTIIVEDNGPGIVKREVPNVFGRLLYGSRFHARRQSLHPSEPVFVLRRGQVSLTPIGILGERFFEEGEEGAIPLPDGIMVPCFSTITGRVRWKAATHIIRHPVAHPMVRIRLDHGGQVRVTANHSLFSFDARTGLTHVEAGVLRPGDYILRPRLLPEVPEEYQTQTLDLMDHIPQGLTVGHRWYVYGVSDRILKEIESSPKVRQRIDPRSKRPQYFYVYRSVAIPVENFRASYRARKFLPLWFVLAAHLQDELLGTCLRTYQTGTGNVLEIPSEVPLSEDLAWLLGLYVAEGHAGARQGALTLGLHERQIAERAERILRGTFRVSTKLLTRRNSLRVSFYSDIMCLLVRRWCGTGAFAKRVPEFIFRAPRTVRKAFMEGLITGDGSNAHPSNQLDYSTVSPRLANELAYLWRMEGVTASVKETRGGSLGRRPRRAHRVSVFGDDLTVLSGFPLKKRTLSNMYRRFPTAQMGAGIRTRRLHVEANRVGGISAFLGAGPGFAEKYLDRLEGRPVPRRRGRFDSALREGGYLDAFNQPTDKAREVLSVASAVEWFGTTDLELARVESIEVINTPGWVYDLSVPGDGTDENFVAGDHGPVFVKNSRGQQGLGISGAVMYGQVTTGKATKITSKIEEEDTAYYVELIVDTKKNMPNKVREDRVVWERAHGTRVEIPLKGRYIGGKQSIQEYLKATAIVNPHARITYKPPEGDPIVFERATEELPPKTKEIPPHPHGIELGTLMQMMKETKSYKLSAFLEEEFVRVSARVAKEICDAAGLDPETKPKSLGLEQAKALHEAMQNAKLMAPPTDCLSPIGERLIKKGLKNVLGNLRPEFYAPPVTRDPSVYTGNPFQVEVGIVFGGDLPPDQPVEVLRFANRVPLMYQAGGCALTQAVAHVDWRRYGLEQRGGEGLPFGPAIVLVHVCSTKVPYTSEAKEAVATVDEIMEELDLALKECGRRLKTHLTKKAHRAKTREKFEIVQLILPRIAEKSAKIVNKKVPVLDATITKIMGVVWIDETIAYDKKQKRHTITINVHNFTDAGKKLNLHVLLPRGIGAKNFDPKPAEVRDDGKITWELKRIDSVAKASVSFVLEGLDEAEYDESDLYVSDINPALVIGAEPLPGDWELNYAEFEGEEAPPSAEPEDEGEIDYDETEEALDDE
jgi:DNA topoisomerase-6 subunit B